MYANQICNKRCMLSKNRPISSASNAHFIDVFVFEYVDFLFFVACVVLAL